MHVTEEFKNLPFDSEIRKFVLTALSDEYSKKILNYTIEQPRSVVDIVKALDIPMTTAYRRVNSLTDQKILKVTGSIVTGDGKKYFLYKSRIKSINVVFGLDSLDVQIVENKNL